MTNCFLSQKLNQNADLTKLNIVRTKKASLLLSKPHCIAVYMQGRASCIMLHDRTTLIVVAGWSVLYMQAFLWQCSN